MRRRLALHLSVLAVTAGLVRVAVVPAEVCPAVTSDQVRSAVDAASGWLERGVAPDGRYRYGYDRDADVVSGGYNEVRHAGVVMALYQALAATRSPRPTGSTSPATVARRSGTSTTSSSTAAWTAT